LRERRTRGNISALTLAGILALAAGPANAAGTTPSGDTASDQEQHQDDPTGAAEDGSGGMQGGVMGDQAAMAERHQAMQDRVEELEQRIEGLEAAPPPEAPLTAAQSVFHLSGYAFVGLANTTAELGDFPGASFNPILHYTYSDRVMFEGELEFEVEENGETNVVLEYSTIDLLLGENMILVAGKFLSPIGNFRQNLHPAWINRLASAPVGFGHDGAAPLADVGLQLRGGWTSGSHRFNYATFITNGPELVAEGGEIHAIETEGFGRDADGTKLIGGRLGYLPFPELEIAVSAATGNVTVTIDDDLDISGDPNRNYEVLGFDFGWRPVKGLDVRGEYISQDVAGAATSVAPDGGKWAAWYLQGAYRFNGTPWESVLRLGDLNSPHSDDIQQQVAVGVNYYFGPGTQLKFSYEFNDGEPGEATNDDRWLVQLAYGF
jgi:hypothetical protein